MWFAIPSSCHYRQDVVIERGAVAGTNAACSNRRKPPFFRGKAAISGVTRLGTSLKDELGPQTQLTLVVKASQIPVHEGVAGTWRSL